MTDTPTYIGGNIFDKIQTDPRVTSDLAHCLYCRVSSQYIGDLEYKIPLNCINGNIFKECPACKRIYVLSNPIE